MLTTCSTKTLNLRIVTGTGGFTVAWFVAMFENLTKMVCLIWNFSRGGWKTAFLPGNTKWRTNCYRLCSSIKTVHFKEFWILILQYNNSQRAPLKSHAKIEAKSKRGSKESWVEPNGHNRDQSRIRLIVTPQWYLPTTTEVWHATIINPRSRERGCLHHRLNLYLLSIF